MVIMFAAVVVVVLMAILFEFAVHRVYGYTLTPTHLEIRLAGRIPLYRVALRKIADVQVWRFSVRDVLAMFVTLRLGNRIFSRPIVIRLDSRFPRYIIITPDDANAFITQLRRMTSTHD